MKNRFLYILIKETFPLDINEENDFYLINFIFPVVIVIFVHGNTEEERRRGWKRSNSLTRERNVVFLTFCGAVTKKSTKVTSDSTSKITIKTGIKWTEAVKRRLNGPSTKAASESLVKEATIGKRGWLKEA